MIKNILEGTRVYLSGPMDFVGSRVIEKFLGWRAILTPILKALDITVLDPWNKPSIKGHENYGKEGVIHSKSEYEKDFWTNPETRARFETDFWETVHIDLRMTDIADFLIAFVPTNIYSVGTVHEIVMGRNQWKPTLVISPPIKYDFFPEIACLPEETKKVLKYYGLKENPKGIPSQWYGNIVGGNYFFDGFGWEGLEFKTDDFYRKLIVEVVNNAKPEASNDDEMEVWNRVSEWVEKNDGLNNLTGGILDHIKYETGEQALLKQEMERTNENSRKYFWYNTPYKPKRSLLYQIFSIASGYIPPRLQIITKQDKNGNVTYESYESIDDSWLLISHDDDE
ncbi:MAG: hypothetical protein GF364_10025 [Candidatus Lokiarchaeota archaeon]|nr:hypothetical protein [Candidatus Lokiarchaeota archaeon]